MAAHFTPETMRFLRGLAKNNDRTWFEERRPVYERSVKAPMLAVVEEINVALDDFAPEHVRPPHKVAMRIFRDTRFSPDKRPYKAHVSAWWARRGLEKTDGAGFYLQIGPVSSFVSAGLYVPEREGLLAVRRWLAEHHERYRDVLAPLLKAKGKRTAMEPIDPNALTRNPKGFPPEHPASDLVRARNWGVSLPLAAESTLSETLAHEVADTLRRTAPLVDLLNEAFQTTRTPAIFR
ncbi:MAG: DUF2461 domain-containing protein [Janthinobacterium lividum]